MILKKSRNISSTLLLPMAVSSDIALVLGKEDCKKQPGREQDKVQCTRPPPPPGPTTPAQSPRTVGREWLRLVGGLTLGISSAGSSAGGSFFLFPLSSGEGQMTQPKQGTKAQVVDVCSEGSFAGGGHCAHYVGT